jgi:lipoprotein signal peptidase
MSALCIVMLAVVVADQTIKFTLRRLLATEALPLGRYGSVRLVTGRIWLRQIRYQCSDLTLWCIWSAAATALVLASALANLSALYVGLVLGSSFSHAAENAWRGSITDYICLRSRVFNLADLVFLAGVLGIAAELLMMVQQKTF